MQEQISESGCAANAMASWNTRIAAAKLGDRDAQELIFKRLGPWLRVRARVELDGQLQVKVSPSDVVQETLLAAHCGFSNFFGQTRSELVLWLQGILKHRVQTAYRRYRGTTKRNIARETRLELVDQSNQYREFAITSSSPSGHAAATEELCRLEAALKGLPTRYEQVIRLRNELKLSFAEVAIALNCSIDAAQKLWGRAVKELSRKLISDEPQSE